MEPVRARTIEEAVSRAVETFTRPLVVVVDGDPAHRERLAAWVESAGYEAAPAGCATAGLALLARRPAAAVVLDLDEGGPGGPATLDLLRTTDPAIPVVAVASGRERAADLLLHRADEFLVKPVGREPLARALAAARRPVPAGAR